MCIQHASWICSGIIATRLAWLEQAGIPTKADQTGLACLLRSIHSCTLVALLEHHKFGELLIASDPTTATASHIHRLVFPHCLSDHGKTSVEKPTPVPTPVPQTWDGQPSSPMPAPCCIYCRGKSQESSQKSSRLPSELKQAL